MRRCSPCPAQSLPTHCTLRWPAPGRPAPAGCRRAHRIRSRSRSLLPIQSFQTGDRGRPPRRTRRPAAVPSERSQQCDPAQHLVGSAEEYCSVQAAFRREGSQIYWLYAGARVVAAAVIVPAPNLETILITHLATTGALRNHGLMASLIERIFDAQPDPWCVELLGFFRSQPIGNAPAQTDALHALIGLALQKDWSYHFAADPSDIDPVLSHLLEEDDLKLLAQICPCVTGVRSIRSLIAFGYTPLLISTRGFLLPDQFEETRIVLSTFSEAASSSSVYMPTPSVASTYNARLSLLPAADGSLSASILVTPEAALQPVCLCSTRGFKLPTIAIIAHYSSEYCRLPRLTESGVPPLPRSWLFPRLFACLAMIYASGLAARTPLTSMHILCAIQCCLDKLKFWLLCLVMLSLQIMSIACKSSVTTLYQTSNYMLASLLCFLVWLPGTSAMGLVFANSPATGDALRAARDEHLVYAISGCLALAAFVPALGGRVINPNQHVYPLRAILWLLLPCTRLHGRACKIMLLPPSSTSTPFTGSCLT